MLSFFDVNMSVSDVYHCGVYHWVVLMSHEVWFYECLQNSGGMSYEAARLIWLITFVVANPNLSYISAFRMSEMF